MSVGGRDGCANNHFKLREQRLRLLSKIVHVALGKRRSLRKFDPERVTMDSSNPELIVKVGASGKPGAPHVSNDLALLDPLPWANSFREPREMSIEGGVG